jgi:hypothetical protein
MLNELENKILHYIPFNITDSFQKKKKKTCEYYGPWPWEHSDFISDLRYALPVPAYCQEVMICGLTTVSGEHNFICSEDCEI